MSQPDSTLADPAAPRSSGPSDRGTAYVSLMIVSLIAVLIGSLFLLLEQRQWYIDNNKEWPPAWLYTYIFACLLALGATISTAVTNRWN